MSGRDELFAAAGRGPEELEHAARGMGGAAAVEGHVDRMRAGGELAADASGDRIFRALRGGVEERGAVELHRVRAAAHRLELVAAGRIDAQRAMPRDGERHV